MPHAAFRARKVVFFVFAREKWLVRRRGEIILKWERRLHEVRFVARLKVGGELFPLRQHVNLPKESRSFTRVRDILTVESDRIRELFDFSQNLQALGQHGVDAAGASKTQVCVEFGFALAETQQIARWNVALKKLDE